MQWIRAVDTYAMTAELSHMHEFPEISINNSIVHLNTAAVSALALMTGTPLINVTRNVRIASRSIICVHVHVRRADSTADIINENVHDVKGMFAARRHNVCRCCCCTCSYMYVHVASQQHVARVLGQSSLQQR